LPEEALQTIVDVAQRLVEHRQALEKCLVMAMPPCN